MIKGFKEFIVQGNVIDLAVAVVIGGAFTVIVTALVDNFINPLVGAFVPSGDLASWAIEIPGIFAPAHLGIGAIISAIIKFISIALVVYLVLVLPMNKYKERQAARVGAPAEEEALPTEAELLVQIRDLLQNQNPTRA